MNATSPTPSRTSGASGLLLLAGALALGGGLFWYGSQQRFGPAVAPLVQNRNPEPAAREIANVSASREALRRDVDELTRERAALERRIEQFRQEGTVAETHLEEAQAALKSMTAQFTTLNGRIAELSGINQQLSSELVSRQGASDRKVERLREEIERRERTARDEAESWRQAHSRWLASNENLRQQNAILKDRLTGTLRESFHPPEDSNAEAALRRGNLEIEAIKTRIINLEQRLNAVGEQRNELARLLRKAQTDMSGSTLLAATGSDAGDRLIADLSRQVDALKRQADKSRTAWERERTRWQAERRELAAARDVLLARVADLTQKVAGLKRETAPVIDSAPIADRASDAPPAMPADSRPPAAAEEGLVVTDDSKRLSGPAHQIFETLRSLDDTPAAIETAYAAIKRELKAEPLLTLSFRADDASIQSRYDEEIETLASKTSGGARFLVIGYASIDGNESSNRNLSSRRALTVAERIAELQPEAAIEAVYFGQTHRFHPRRRSPNRVVEIWRVL